MGGKEERVEWKIMRQTPLVERELSDASLLFVTTLLVVFPLRDAFRVRVVL